MKHDFSLSIDSHTKHLEGVRAFIESVVGSIPNERRSEDLFMRCKVAVVEAVNNAIFHAHDTRQEKPIQIHCDVTPKQLVITVSDSGDGFDLNAAALPNADQEHGRGIYLIQSLMDEVAIENNEDGAQLRMACHLSSKSGFSHEETRLLNVISQLSDAISSTSSVEEVCDVILNEATKLIPVSKASIMKYDRHNDTLRIVAAKGLSQSIVETARVKVGEGISGRVFESKRPILVDDIRLVPGVSGRDGYKGASLISAPVTCFPMSVGKHPVGVINMTDKEDGSRFTDSDLTILTAIANQTAAYLHLCDLADQAKEAERVASELDMARAIQMKFLPKKIGSITGFDVAGICQMAAKVGGDYFNLYSESPHEPLAVIADVAGHSMGSALIVATLRSLLRSNYLMGNYIPSALLDFANETLYDELSESDQFICLIATRLNQKKREITYSIAGSHPPRIYRPSQDLFIRHTADYGPPIGVIKKSTYGDHRVKLQSGDLIFMYTDGILSAASPSGGGFTEAMIEAHMKNVVALSAQDIVNATMRTLHAFTKGTPILDDVTLMVIKVL